MNTSWSSLAWRVGLLRRMAARRARVLWLRWWRRRARPRREQLQRMRHLPGAVHYVGEYSDAPSYLWLHIENR